MVAIFMWNAPISQDAMDTILGYFHRFINYEATDNNLREIIQKCDTTHVNDETIQRVRSFLNDEVINSKKQPILIIDFDFTRRSIEYFAYLIFKHWITIGGISDVKLLELEIK